MTIRVCDVDTMNAGDTSILGYVFMEQYKLDDYQEEAYMRVYKPTMEEVRKAEKLLRSKYFSIMPPERRDRWGRAELKKGLVCVRDGGNYFWHTLLNISDGKVLSVMINGEA